MSNRILVVEDEAITAMQISKSLNQLGFKVISIVDKEKKLFKKQNYSIQI
ncbi:hypothetical protein [Methanobacterium sp. ACI-7]